MNTAKKLNIVRVKQTEQESRGRIAGRLWFTLLKGGLVAVIVTAALVWGSHQVVNYWQVVNARARGVYYAALSRVTRVEVRREIVRPDSVPLQQLIRAVSAKNRVPVVVLQAVIDQESAGGEHLYRFEPTTYANLRKRERGSDSEVRMLASSHGVAHVMGFNAKPRCNVHWSKLYDTAVGLECGAKLLRENIDRYSDVRDASRRIWLALRDYNGSGPAAEEYATQVMARIGAFLLGDLRNEM